MPYCTNWERASGALTEYEAGWSLEEVCILCECGGGGGGGERESPYRHWELNTDFTVVPKSTAQHNTTITVTQLSTLLHKHVFTSGPYGLIIK
jgi:hypothetical protein